MLRAYISNFSKIPVLYVVNCKCLCDRTVLYLNSGFQDPAAEDGGDGGIGGCENKQPESFSYSTVLIYFLAGGATVEL